MVSFNASSPSRKLSGSRDLTASIARRGQDFCLPIVDEAKKTGGDPFNPVKDMSVEIELGRVYGCAEARVAVKQPVAVRQLGRIKSPDQKVDCPARRKPSWTVEM